MKKNKHPILRIVEERHEVFVYGVRKKITHLEFGLLVALKKSNKTMSRLELLNAVWPKGEYEGIETRTVDQHVKRLRDKLGFMVVESVPYVGYRIASL